MTRGVEAKSESATLDYEALKRLARDRDPAVRQQIAARGDVRPEILYYLAEDPEPRVRQAVARNERAPRHADLLLARDTNGAVRTDLTRKISRLTPDLAPDEHDRLYHVVVQTLEVLAQDQLLRVRRLLAKSLKDVASAPPSVILRLARDAELSVCQPVLEFSPVLTDDDLLDIIASEPVQGSLAAVSRRAYVGETVADAVARAGDADAIAELLANHGAQVREELLDRLIEDAPQHPHWHAPIIRRPRLSNSAAVRLTRFLTQSLLRELQRRSDLDEPTLLAISEDIERRIQSEQHGADDDEPRLSPKSTKVDPGWQRGTSDADDKFDPDWSRGESGSVAKFEPSWAADDAANDQAPDQAKPDQPAERAITDALARGDHTFVVETVASKAGIDEDVVHRAVSLRDAKGIVAIAWKAGLSMRIAMQLQLQFAGVAPGDLVRPAGDAEYPMADDEMCWQLEFLARNRG